METEDPLLRRARDQADLLARAQAAIEDDQRIVAAWLFGSLARGNADALSDIDLWTVVDDARIDEVIAERRQYVGRIGAVLHCYDGPQNAPTGGAYLMTLYQGGAGPVQVDWYWQPRARAAIPLTARLLFNRGGAPFAAPDAGPLEPARPADPGERRALAARRASFFWVMANIAAKHIARGLHWSAIGQLDMLRRQLWETEWLLELRADHHLWKDSNRRAEPPVHAQEQLALLRRMCGEMESLQPLLAGTPDAISPETIAAIRAFFSVVEGLIPT